MITHPDNFLPLIVGKIEATSKGSILFITYRMFPSTLFYLSFLCLMLLLASLFFSGSRKKLATSGQFICAFTGNLSYFCPGFQPESGYKQKALEKTLSEG
jgi:hypothetical protein